MFAAIKGFLAALWSMPPGWRLWLACLVFLNLLAPAFFPGRPEARIVAAVFLVQAAVMLLLFRLQGFTRLLGLAHAGWLGLAACLFPRLAAYPAGTGFGLWLRVLLLVNGISLVIDGTDVVRYALGERKPLRNAIAKQTGGHAAKGGRAPSNFQSAIGLVLFEATIAAVRFVTNAP